MNRLSFHHGFVENFYIIKKQNRSIITRNLSKTNTSDLGKMEVKEP